MSREPIEREEFLGAVESVLHEYIPHQLLQEAKAKRKNVEVKGKNMIQFYMDNSNKKLRMYGTAKELEETLGFYWKIPMSYKLFSVENGSICNIPQTYKSLKGEDFCCKQNFVRGFIYATYIGPRKISQKLTEHLEKYIRRLVKSLEFAKFDKNVCSEMQKCFIQETEEDSDDLEVFKRIVSAFPTIFLPNSETKDQTATVVVRIFEEGDRTFVMESELFNAINFKNPDEKPLECEDPEGYLRTIEMKEVYTSYRDRISGIDFIRFPIVRTRHTSFPIPTPSGDFCILASGVLYDILYRLTFVLNVFQKVKRNSWQMVVKYISILDKYFPPDMKYMYFINITLVKKLREETDEFWNSLDEKPVKAVRDVGRNGFTPEDVRKEFKYLGITDILPEVASHAKTYCSLAKSLKTTSDMFSLLDKCQFVCIYDRFPSIRNFLHYQKQCGEVPYENCEICNEKKLENKRKMEEVEKNFKKQEMIHVANSKFIDKKEDNLKKERDVLEEKLKKTDDLIKQLNEIQKEVTKKNKRNEKIHKKKEKKELKNETNESKILLEETVKETDALEKEIQKGVTKKTTKPENSLTASEGSRSAEFPDNKNTVGESSIPKISKDSSLKAIQKEVAEKSEKPKTPEDFEKTPETASSPEGVDIALKGESSKLSADPNTIMVQTEEMKKIEEPDAILESPNSGSNPEATTVNESAESKVLKDSSAKAVRNALEDSKVAPDAKNSSDTTLETVLGSQNAMDSSETIHATLECPEILEDSNTKETKKAEEPEDSKVTPKVSTSLEASDTTIIESLDAPGTSEASSEDPSAEGNPSRKTEICADCKKLEKENKILEENARKTYELEKQLKQIQKEMTEKNEEVEKLKQANLELIKAKDEEIEKLKEHQTQEIEKRDKKIDHLNVDNIQISNENQNLKLITKQNEETEVQLRQEIKKLTEKHCLLEIKMATKLKVLGAVILEKDRIIKDLQKSSLPTTSVYSESSTSSETPSPNAFKLQDLLNKRNALDIDSLLEEALEMKNRLISISNQPEIHEMANEEYQKYEDGLKKYQRAIEMNIQLLEGTKNVEFVIPIPEFPSLSARFTGEHWAAVEQQIIENRMRIFRS